MKKSWRFGRFDTMKEFIRCDADKWISFFFGTMYIIILVKKTNYQYRYLFSSSVFFFCSLSEAQGE